MKKIFSFIFFSLFLYSADLQINKAIFDKVDKEDKDTKEFIQRYLNSDYGLYAYKTNYFIPFSYANKVYNEWSEDGIVENSEYKKYEAEFQISLRKPLSYNFFGLNEIISFAYTQKSWWQIYINSAPFRETNYQPEIFVTFLSPKDLDKKTNIKAFRVGLLHESNGQAGERSRSWNRLYFGTILQKGSIFANVRVWYRIPEKKEDDDNPDILKYMGYGDISILYIYKKNHLGLVLRNNLRTSENKGAIMLDWSRPLPYMKDSFLYVKLFSGYGESLIDYNRSVSKISIGFSFSRGLF